MKEAIEEFGTTVIVCIIGAVVLLGVVELLKDSGIIYQLADAYTDLVYGETIS